MFVYRVANAKYKQFTLTGIGAEKVGGRWNEAGTRAVYCSDNVSLALLEYYVHTRNMAVLPKQILVAKIFIPDDFEIEEIETLPERWNANPYTLETAQIFTVKARDPNFFALKVPSTIVGLESNYVLNPFYKDFGKVAIEEFYDLPIDPRLS